MKLSVSAYTAQASAHKNLCSYQHQRSYGATSQASTARAPSDLAAVLPALKVSRFTIYMCVSSVYVYIFRARLEASRREGKLRPTCRASSRLLARYFYAVRRASRLSPLPIVDEFSNIITQTYIAYRRERFGYTSTLRLYIQSADSLDLIRKEAKD